MDRMSLLFAATTIAIIAPAEAGAIDQWEAHIAAAAQRFRVPENWIRAVLDAESKGDPRKVSPKGAMGLMQLMPGTWQELRVQHNLGPDPFDPRANILAGAAYLEAMRDRFGYPGLFAAYNAGPTRYEDHLRAGKPLPAETQAYMAGLESVLSSDSGASAKFAPRNTNRTGDAARNARVITRSRLFFPLSTSGTGGEGKESSTPSTEIFAPLSTWKRDDN